jgi:hypothetical protein
MRSTRAERTHKEAEQWPFCYDSSLVEKMCNGRFVRSNDDDDDEDEDEDGGDDNGAPRTNGRRLWTARQTGFRMCTADQINRIKIQIKKAISFNDHFDCSAGNG